MLIVDFPGRFRKRPRFEICSVGPQIGGQALQALRLDAFERAADQAGDLLRRSQPPPADPTAVLQVPAFNIAESRFVSVGAVDLADGKDLPVAAGWPLQEEQIALGELVAKRPEQRAVRRSARRKVTWARW